jgi:hypothetical protein
LIGTVPLFATFLEVFFIISLKLKIFRSTVLNFL